MEVEALGTTFDVKGYDDDAMVSTSLIEGSVRVSHQNQSVLLAPSEEASFDKTKLVFAKSKIEDSRQVDFWRRNILYFRSATLAEIAKTMERLYGVSVEFESDELKTSPSREAFATTVSRMPSTSSASPIRSPTKSIAMS